MSARRHLAAARWIERLADDASLAASARFVRWRGDPANADAYAALSATRERVAALADHPDLHDLRAETAARSAANDHERPVRWTAAAAAFAAAVALPLVFVAQNKPAAISAPQAVTYRTTTGQRLEIALPDRSRLTLDTVSQVRVAFDGAERRLHLDRGQAMFEVAHAKRPFIVTAAGRDVTAHGTRFDVRLRPDGVQIALVEGGVSVGFPGAMAVRMRPNDLLVADRAGMRVRRDPAAVAALIGWREGLLVFQDRTLADAVAEMNRYVARPVLLGDPAVGRIRVSGSFRTGETRAFVDTLQLGFPVQAALRADGSVVLTAKP